MVKKIKNASEGHASNEKQASVPVSYDMQNVVSRLKEIGFKVKQQAKTITICFEKESEVENFLKSLK